MKAVLVTEKVVACPSCLNPQFRIVRRETNEERHIINHCVCENCGSTFDFTVDKRDHVMA